MYPALFILWLKEKCRQKSEENRSGYSAGSGGESAGKRAEKAVIRNGASDAFRKKVAEARKGNRRTGPSKVNEGLIEPEGGKNDAGDDEAH